MVNEKKQASGVKRRAEESEEDDEGYSTSSSYAPSAIDVSFNYVAPTEIDFTALKRLVQQLYHTHAAEIDVGALADQIITSGDAEKRGDAALGTVVKVEDDEDGDPFAFASAIDLSASAEGEATKTLRTYYAKTLKETNKAIVDVLVNEHVVQIFHERMINMPPQIMPPLYRMLFDEIKADARLSKASHFLFFSRVFSTAALDDQDDENEESGDVLSKGKGATATSKKMKKNAAVTNQAITKVASSDVGVSSSSSQQEEVGLFHPEDTFLAKRAVHTSTFRFPSVKDSDDSFNAPMYGRIALIKNDATLIDSLLQQMTDAFTLST